MKRQHQASTAPGEGDCYRTAIACILDMDRDDVPDFKGTGPQQYFASRDWCLGHGVLLEITSGDLVPKGRLYVGIGRSPRGRMHACVCCDGEVVWDPHPDGGGLVQISQVMVLGVIPKLDG